MNKAKVRAFMHDFGDLVLLILISALVNLAISMAYTDHKLGLIIGWITLWGVIIIINQNREKKKYGYREDLAVR
jgi:hypothetical protein